MFVEASRALPVGWPAACAALRKGLADGGLLAESRRAVADGLVFVMPVGPRGKDHFSARDVLIRVQSTSTEERTMRVALSWDPLGVARHVLPSFDGTLSLDDSGPDASSLSIVASYRPPLSVVGAVVDRAIMYRVANETINALLREVAEHIEQLVEPGEPQPTRDT